MAIGLDAIVRAVLLAIGLAVAGFAAAQAERTITGAGVASDSARQLIEQKKTMVEQMLHKSALASRVAASGNAEAKTYLSKAANSLSRAQGMLTAGDAAGAGGVLDEAMALIGKARQLVPDPATKLAEERVKYAQAVDSIESLKKSYQANLEQEKNPARQAATAENLKNVDRLVSEAQKLAAAGDLIQANKVLDKAVALTLQGLQGALGGQTVVYERKFSDPKEEFDWELERNRSVEFLVPVAMSQFRPSPETVRLIEKQMEQNRVLVEQAKQQSHHKEYRSAIEALQQATEALEHALRLAGLTVPR